MKPDEFDDDEASATAHIASSGYAAVTTNTGAFDAGVAKVTAGRRYQALAPERNGGFSKVGLWRSGRGDLGWVD